MRERERGGRQHTEVGTQSIPYSCHFSFVNQDMCEEFCSGGSHFCLPPFPEGLAASVGLCTDSITSTDKPSFSWLQTRASPHD